MEKDKNEVKKTIVQPLNPSRIKSNQTYSATIISKPMTEFDKKQGVINKTVSKQEKIIPEVIPPKNKKKTVILAIIFVLIGLIVAISLLLTILPKPFRPNNIFINFNVNAEIKGLIINDPDNPDQRPIEIKGIMPGDKLDASFKISSSAAEGFESGNLDVFVRIRSYAICDDNYYSNVFDFNLMNESEWFGGADGYKYFNAKLSPTTSEKENTINAIKCITIKKDLNNFFSGKKIQIVFVAEALQANYQAIEEYWATAPYEWAVNFK